MSDYSPNRLSVRINPELKTKATKLAAENGLDLSSFIRMIITRELKSYETND